MIVVKLLMKKYVYFLFKSALNIKRKKCLLKRYRRIYSQLHTYKHTQIYIYTCRETNENLYTDIYISMFKLYQISVWKARNVIR